MRWTGSWPSNSERTTSYPSPTARASWLSACARSFGDQRRKSKSPWIVFRFDRLSIDIPGHEVTVEGRVVGLTALEFKLLIDLARHRGFVRSREALLEAVWHHAGTLETRTVDTHIKRLREKLGDVGRQIETVRGVGYRLK